MSVLLAKPVSLHKRQKAPTMAELAKAREWLVRNGFLHLMQGPAHD